MNKSQVTGSLKDGAGSVQKKAGKLLGAASCKPREQAIRLLAKPNFNCLNNA